MRRIIRTIHVKLKGEVYGRIYGLNDLKEIINLFNSIHGDQMKIEIMDVEEKTQ